MDLIYWSFHSSNREEGDDVNEVNVGEEWGVILLSLDYIKIWCNIQVIIHRMCMVSCVCSCKCVCVCVCFGVCLGVCVFVCLGVCVVYYIQFTGSKTINIKPILRLISYKILLQMCKK